MCVTLSRDETNPVSIVSSRREPRRRGGAMHLPFPFLIYMSRFGLFLLAPFPLPLLFLRTPPPTPAWVPFPVSLTPYLNSYHSLTDSVTRPTASRLCLCLLPASRIQTTPAYFTEGANTDREHRLSRHSPPYFSSCHSLTTPTKVSHFSSLAYPITNLHLHVTPWIRTSELNEYRRTVRLLRQSLISRYPSANNRTTSHSPCAYCNHACK